MNATALAGITSCVFDAFGTLLDLGSLAPRLEPLLGAKTEQVRSLWRSKQLEYSWLHSLMGSYVDFEQLTQDALSHALEQAGVAGRAAIEAELRGAYARLSPYHDAVPALERLVGCGIRCAVLSNGSRSMLRSLFTGNALEPLLQAVLSVDDVQVYKPASSVYELAARQLDLAPARIAFVSANAWDVHGAAYFGFRSIWLNRAHAAAERLPGTPVLELGSLIEVADALAPRAV